MQQPEQKKGWLSRNWKWVLPVGCLGVVVVGVAVVLLGLSAVFGTMKSSDVYKQAVARASANAAVKRELGEPIETGWLVNGRINFSGSNGDADISIPLEGPKKKGTLHAVATKTSGQWKFSTLQVEFDDDTSPINVLEPGGPEFPR